MQFSVIWELSKEEKKNQMTLDCLKKQVQAYGKTVQILIYAEDNGQQYEKSLSEKNIKIQTIHKDSIPQNSNLFEDAKQYIKGRYVTFLSSGDKWSDDMLSNLEKETKKNPHAEIIMMQKVMPDGKPGPFTGNSNGKKVENCELYQTFHCYPYYFGGTILLAETFQQYPFENKFGMGMECGFFLRLCAEKKHVLYLKYVKYFSGQNIRIGGATAGPAGKNTDIEDTEGCNKDWYIAPFTKFWLPFLEEMKVTYGKVPLFIQYHLMFTVKNCILNNQKVQERKINSKGYEEDWLDLMRNIFSYIDDDVWMNCHKVKESQVEESLKWVYGILKYGKKFHFEQKYVNGSVYYGYSNTILNQISALKIKLLSMNYEAGYLSIDGMVPPILFAMTDEIYFKVGEKKERFCYTDSSEMTTVFGIEVYNYHPFHIDIPMHKISNCHFICFADFTDGPIQIAFTFDSFFGRLSEVFQNNYWSFGPYMAFLAKGGIKVKIASEKEKRAKERALEWEMLQTRSKQIMKYSVLRRIYFIRKRALMKKPIWLYIGGTGKSEDRIESLYRYACKKKDGIAHYYLVDKNSDLITRLKKAGYKPIIKNSMEHRLLFLMADMVITSQHNVFALNGYNHTNEDYIKDLVHFNVCYVPGEKQLEQNEMAKNQLYDSSSLYFSVNGEDSETVYHEIAAFLEKKEQTSFEYAERICHFDEIEKIASENGIKPAKRNVTDNYYEKRICKNTIVMVGLGKSVRGSMQYILNELNDNERYSSFHIYVRTGKDTENTVQAYIRENGWIRTETVLDDARYMEVVESAQYLITEVYFPEAWVKKEGQIYINIWHGTPLKKLGLSKNMMSDHRDGNTQRNFIDADYLLYPNEYTKKHMLESYKVSEFMDGKVVNLGYPRTGGMLAASKSNQEKLRKQLAPNGEKIYAYMPTWKDYLEVGQVVAESKELLDYLDANLSENQILYVNLHHKVSDSLDYSVYKRIKKFPPTVDSYQLLALTDALITDYSSVFYDYLVLRRQIILYCPDYALYHKKRGTYMDLMELPFDKAVTKEEVIAAINRGKTYDDGAAFQEFCSYDSVDNARKLCSLFSGTEEQVDIEAIPKSGRKKVLIYTEQCENSDDTKRLQEYIDIYDKKNLSILVSCDRDLLGKNKKIAYPMLHQVPVLGISQAYHLSSVGLAAKTLYKKNLISFEQALEIWKYDYAVAAKRFLGRAVFDLAVIYDITDPEKLLTLTYLETDNKILCISEIVKNNTFLCHAIKAAAPRMKKIFVGSNEHIATVQKLLGDDFKIELMERAEELKQVIDAAVKDKGE